MMLGRIKHVSYIVAFHFDFTGGFTTRALFVVQFNF